MLLANRGWSGADLISARPDILSAARWALYAERRAGDLESAEMIRDQPISDGMSHDQRFKVGVAKAKAAPFIDALRSILFPKDDDG